jgi:hypothetical protein
MIPEETGTPVNVIIFVLRGTTDAMIANIVETGTVRDLVQTNAGITLHSGDMIHRIADHLRVRDTTRCWA